MFVYLPNVIAGNDKCGRAEISFFTDSDPCITNELKDETILGLKPDCHLTCEVKTNLVKKCGDSNSGNRLITNGVYFIFRMMATMALASCFILLDAQTIQMCNVEEKRGKKGAYGRQILYKTLAQVTQRRQIILDRIQIQLSLKCVFDLYCACARFVSWSVRQSLFRTSKYK